MELKPNMYVRTKEGYIAKYDDSKHNCSGKYYGFASTIRDLKWEEYDDDCFLWESELKSIIKTSYSIIDLLLVGDYVNGHKVSKVVITPLLRELELEEVGYYVDSPEEITEEDIKSIVTKEQFSSMEYRLGEK